MIPFVVERLGRVIMHSSVYRLQVKPQVPSKEASPDSDSTQISEKQRKDPIVKEYALVDPRKFANEPAPGRSFLLLCIH